MACNALEEDARLRRGLQHDRVRLVLGSMSVDIDEAQEAT